MPSPGERLARSITRSANGHADATIRLLVDRPRVGDAYRAYAYFRWIDDRLDLGELDRAQAAAFLARQHALISATYRGEPWQVCEPEEALAIELIRGDFRPEAGLASYIHNMMQVMAFDADRRGRQISTEELACYTRWLATAVTEALHHFIGQGSARPDSSARYLAAAGAHMVHMLRDTADDVAHGYFNIPHEVLTRGGIEPQEIDSPPYRAWARRRAARARRCLRLGRAYFTRVGSLRCRIAGLAYCLRFERCLEEIERAGYCLRPPEAKSGESTAVFLAALAAAVRGAPESASPPAWRRSTAGPARLGRP